ncbi:hypothetical protein NECAME_06951 [Necator americanus]|uniref:Uncharacterized protein n=1 Tax=Necator americanus TaxID=51031 RepID=W2TR69_NECAM|nr:hypothetical protein NECAME_06951 [Necator americanus]ETN84263.1 hypothetical protein NECAME_06951 [Necator americanus]
MKNSCESVSGSLQNVFTDSGNSVRDARSWTIVAKRGGARAFHSYFNVPNAKRLSVAAPYYLYEKRGGGRAFVGGWQPFDGISGRMERRGGGRAFSGWWGPNEYFSRFYENPYYKRSSNLWEFLEDRNGF